MSEGMFEKASRLKLRFDSLHGRITVEDLWDTPLKGAGINLNDIAKALHRATKEADEVSFVDDLPEPNEDLQLMFSIVKRVIEVRLAEQKAAEDAELTRQKKQQIMAIIQKKEVEDLEGKSIKDLQELINDL